MDDPAFTACFEACSGMSRRASRLIADHQDCMHRSREQLALSRRLLAIRVYPNDGVPPHNPFDYNGFKTTEQSE